MNEKPLNTNRGEEIFHHYLRGESQLSKLYQQLETPEPSAQLNQIILNAAKKEASRKSWWTKPASWAATIALVSITGLLTHNTWKKEQDQQQIPFPVKMEQRSFSEFHPDSDSGTQDQDIVETESASPAKPVMQQATAVDTVRKRKDSPDNQINDSRKLIFKSAPVPVLQTAPKSLLLEQSDPGLSEKDIELINTQPNSFSAQTTTKPAGSSVQESLEEKTTYSDQITGGLTTTASLEQQWLGKISQLLENNQTEEARRLLDNFRKKYPNYPVDPVILQQLSPY